MLKLQNVLLNHLKTLRFNPENDRLFKKVLSYYESKPDKVVFVKDIEGIPNCLFVATVEAEEPIAVFYPDSKKRRRKTSAG